MKRFDRMYRTDVADRDGRICRPGKVGRSGRIHRTDTVDSS